jgi:hypothetical protein
MSARNRLTARIAFDKAVPVQKLEQALPSARRLKRAIERRERKEAAHE